MDRSASRRFRVGRLIVGDGSPPLPDVLMTVEGGRIASIEPAGRPTDRESADLSGLTVMPGLIDVHVHLAHGGGRHGDHDVFRDDQGGPNALRALSHAQAHLRAGFTSIRVLGTANYADIAVRDAIDAGDFSGPRVFAAGHAIGTTGGHMDQAPRSPESALSWIFDSPESARRVARYQVKMGVDCIKIASDGLQWRPRQGGRVPRGPYREMLPDEIGAVCEVANDAGIHVAAHTDGGQAMRDAVRAGVRTIEHIKDLSEDDARFLADAEVYLTPTMVATSNTLEAGEAASGLSPQAFAFFVRQWEWKRRSFERCLRAGVRMVLGTDGGYALCRHGESARELLRFVECGMTPLEAIRSGTGLAAEAIGQAGDLGTLAPGKIADFIAVRGDPSADVRLLADPSAIASVYKGGALAVSP